MLCARCSCEKDASAFYANDRTCKDCRKAMVRANRVARADQYRDYDRGRANRPDRVAARLAYQKTDAFKAGRPAVLERYRNNHPLHAKHREYLRLGERNECKNKK